MISVIDKVKKKKKKLKACANNKVNVANIMISAIDKVKKKIESMYK